MSASIRFRPQARVELDSATVWYDGGRPGTGAKFEAAVRATLISVGEAPSRYPTVESDIREAPVLGFPYCVYYRERLGTVIVLAVYHQSRDPSGWRGRT